jgi:hypothetical protein
MPPHPGVSDEPHLRQGHAITNIRKFSGNTITGRNGDVASKADDTLTTAIADIGQVALRSAVQNSMSH